MCVRVVKIGGSLWARHRFDVELREWLRPRRDMHNVLIAGGGLYADQVRQLDRRGRVSGKAAHTLAIRAMSLLGWTISQLDVRWIYVERWKDLRQSVASPTSPRILVFDPSEFLRDHEPKLAGTKLPIGWQVTSDSIAARVATSLDAAELTLLKSCQTHAKSAQQASQDGYVDAFFPQAAHQLRRVRCVDFSSGHQTTWQLDSQEFRH